MLLCNLYSISQELQVDILIKDRKIDYVGNYEDISPAVVIPSTIKFNNAIVFPGLINSHDHLEFNSFPQLGNRFYNNYVEWGDDIHRQNKNIIDRVLKIPKFLRIQWGIYKNLLNGITTVVNHGARLPVKDALITVWQHSYSLHSVKLEKRWKYKLNSPFISKRSFSIHIGEGADILAHEEVNEIIKWNLFNRELIGIHAVSIDEKQAARFKALVWCPDSNYFLLGRTGPMDKIKKYTKVLFGTDSTLSSHWSIWHHIRLAKQEGIVTERELFSMLTSVPPDVWGMTGCGFIAKGYDADIVVCRNKSGLKGVSVFCQLNPEDILAVFHKGNIRLFDEEIYSQLYNQGMFLDGFHKIYVNGSCKYISGNLPQLIESIKKYYPEAQFPITW